MDDQQQCDDETKMDDHQQCDDETKMDDHQQCESDLLLIRDIMSFETDDKQYNYDGYRFQSDDDDSSLGPLPRLQSNIPRLIKEEPSELDITAYVQNRWMNQQIS